MWRGGAHVADLRAAVGALQERAVSRSAQADALGFQAAILLHRPLRAELGGSETAGQLIQPHVATRLVGLPDFEANTPGFDNDGHSGGDHAGKVETSLLWALEPECVDVSRVPPQLDDEPYFAMGKNVREANRLTGERMVADEVRWLAAKGRELLDEYARALKPEQRRTFAQTGSAVGERHPAGAGELQEHAGLLGDEPPTEEMALELEGSEKFS